MQVKCGQEKTWVELRKGFASSPPLVRLREPPPHCLGSVQQRFYLLATRCGWLGNTGIGFKFCIRMYLVLYVVAAYSKEFTEERCTTCFSGIKHFSPPFLKDSFSFLFLTITHSHTSDVCLLSLLLPTRSIRLSFPPFGGPS